MSNLSVFSLLLIFAASCYVSGGTEAASKNDDDFLQVINFGKLPNSPNPYTPIQEQQKQLKHEKVRKQFGKRSMLASEAATANAPSTMGARQKRSQHALATTEEYLRSMPTYTYNLALLNILQSLRRQLSDIELARLRSRLSRRAAADLQLFNEIYNNNNNNGEYPGETDSSSKNSDGIGLARGDTDTGMGMGVGMGEAGGVGGAANDMLANDIEDLSVPWQLAARVSKKSSALYKPRLGKRTQKQQQPAACN
ncbi:uncharacterized protein LOC120777392 [Bactrocera tryoni]|uniref:uncharacterized protein LOC120777392 n=1 Tax=Bactrocera tryoni TaxID=59916 RepID=UPI001A961842|nr:uncharacterized protein LOC120777392 [Bactrocera tryoni]XP_039964630.1 uncharacterized protein LOC120777392 [Bactrocera tryoni]